MKTYIVSIILAGAVSLLEAQSPSMTPAPVGLTLTQSVELALEKNQTVAATRARLDAAEARMHGAEVNRLPRLSLSGRAARLSDVPVYSLTLPGIGRQTLFESITHSYSTRIALQQPLFTGFRLTALTQISRYQHDISKSDLRKAKNDLVMEVSATYWNLYKAHRVQELHDEAEQQLRAHLADAHHLHAQGMATMLDLLRIESQLTDVNMKQIEAASAVLLASVRLSALIGTELLVPLRPLDDPVSRMPPEAELSESLPDLIASARGRRPEVRAIEDARRIHEASVSLAKAGWFPQVSLAAAYDYARPNPRVIPPADRWEKTWDVGLVVQWSIWDWFETSHKVDEARAMESEAIAQLNLLSDAIALDVVTQYRRLHEARALVAAGEQHVRRGEEASRVAHEAFRQGVAKSTEVIDTDQSLLQARVNHSVATVEAMLQLKRLKMSLGEDLYH